ncbi:MAG TPA: CsgG/HfaB family protein, partial [Bacteroidia bacterium]|nr:CsgG/HfaB family protein [Bacteroidia bacterium]
YSTAIQDAVGDVFLNTKRFTLVEREKMEQIKSEKNLQKNDDFIDGSVVEQSAALGAQYIVMGNITKAGEDESRSSVPFAGSVTSYHADVAFSIRIVDVSTGEVVASNSFSASGKGKDGFDKALETIKPDIADFIKKNFKLTVSLAQVESKDANGAATKVLIAGGSSVGLKLNDVFKVYEVTVLDVDGKKIPRKVTIGKISVAEIQDENFSECTVTEGGADIASKVAGGSKIKCEIISE